jgi:MarR family transcriptional regulator, lower aerobic nicotinate degradation pathway regulator
MVIECERMITMAERRDLLALVMPLARALRRIEDAAAAGYGLRMWQYAILAMIERRPGLNQAEVASRLDYSKNRIVADLDGLERAGLVVRRRGADRRANELTITAAGRAARMAIQREIHRGEDELLEAVPAATVHGLRAALEEIVRSART